MSECFSIKFKKVCDACQFSLDSDGFFNFWGYGWGFFEVRLLLKSSCKHRKCG